MGWENASEIGDIATAIAAFVAIFALGFAWGQISASRKISRETVAREAYREYLRLATENPDYSGSIMAARKIGLVNREFDWKRASREQCAALFQGLDDKLTPEKYLWYFSFLLSSSESILDHVPQSKGWTETIKDQLRYHFSTLDALWPKWEHHYEQDGRLAKLVREVLKEDPE